jgi:hypothetical protein
MFRVVSQFVEEPFYMLLCDDFRCSTMFRHPLPPEQNATEGEAMKAAQQQGWIVSLGRQLCPGHSSQLRQIEELDRIQNSRILKPRLSVTEARAIPANNVRLSPAVLRKQ